MSNQTVSISDAINLALEHHRAGRLQQAEQVYRQILIADAENADANHLLGALYQQLGKLELAVELITKAIEVDNNQAAYFSNLGLALRAQGKLEEALAAYDAALAINPDYAEAHNNRGNILKAKGKFEDALAAYSSALSINPGYAEAYNNLGSVYQGQGKLVEALAAYDAALAINPDHAEVLYNRGVLAQAHGKLEEALAAFDGALRLKPDIADAHLNRGVVLRAQGKLEEAIEACKNALAIDPELAEAHRQIAYQTTYTDYCDELRRMEELFEKPATGDVEKMQLGFGLGKAYDDLQQFDKAFEYFLKANQIKRGTFDYDITGEESGFEKIKSVFNTPLIDNCSGYGYRGDETPIFIVGMPRSGTTLVEQILASHASVYGAGELTDLKQVILTRPDTTIEEFTDYIPDLRRNDFSMLGNKYMDRLTQLSNGKRFITDKMPGNYIWIGIIRLILPEAKIIHCRRDPTDTCFSCFKQYFAKGQNFTYDLGEVGMYYKLYEDLMGHWHGLFPDYIFEVQYEDLVANQEAQIRGLLKYCGLAWDKACLAFHETDRPVSTASAVQVRRPIYKNSVSSWKNYEKHLGPLRAVLGSPGHGI